MNNILIPEVDYKSEYESAITIIKALLAEQAGPGSYKYTVPLTHAELDAAKRKEVYWESFVGKIKVTLVDGDAELRAKLREALGDVVPTREELIRAFEKEYEL